MSKYYYEEVVLYLQERGQELLSKEFTGYFQQLELKCGHIYTRCLKVIKNGIYHCSIKKSRAIKKKPFLILCNNPSCKKELNTKLEIDYTSKVINLKEYLSDKNLILKAYLRRGLAYE